MSFFTRSLLSMFGGILCIGIVSAALTNSVTYKPFGVPDHRREEYEKKVQILSEVARLARSENARPKVRVDNATYAFGMLNPHETATHSFEIFNDGDSPLELQVTDSSCKCTVGELKQRFVQPGGSTKVTLTWNTGIQADDYEQAVSLSTNDPMTKEILLKVTGEVRAQCVMPSKVTFAKCEWGMSAEANFVVYSQLWSDFEIKDVSCDLRDFQWVAEPLESHDVAIGGEDARSAWRVRMWTFRQDYGQYESNITVRIEPVGGLKSVTNSIAATGSVKPPISFYSPGIHNSDGLDIGTLVSDKEHQFHLVTRVRSTEKRNIQVLDVKPDVLRATLSPTQRNGNFRLTLTVPKDCPTTFFNLDSHHGYVQVGDPDDKNFSNWFPLRGVVAGMSR